MMEAGGGKRTVLDLADAARAVESVVRRHFPELGHAQERQARAAEWLGFECLGSGIVEEVAGNRVRFWHLTFQEHLAAVQLAWREEGEASERDEEGQERHWWPAVRPRLSDAQWRETVDLLPGCLLDEGGEGRVDRLLERVLALRGERPDLAAEARVAGVTGRLLAHVRVYGYRPPPAVEEAYGEALARALEVFTPEGAARVPVADRIAAAEALGQAGDPRLAVPQVERLLPVPGRPGLLLGRYPVTVEEYRAFVDVRGYEERRWWTEAGWSAREEGGWEAPDEWEAQLRTPNRPVVRVSWHEAVAYCRWLSDLCGREVRLPEEEVWEAAAMHPDGPYPWGAAEPDAERANFAPDRKPNVGASTPVGVYPAGAGRGGHLDLGGNVWEWCADRATVVDGEEDERALRGGAWDFSRVELRVAYRFRHVAVVRWYLVGFRISSSPVSPEA